jgi:hypothetical protein
MTNPLPPVTNNFMTPLLQREIQQQAQ